MKTIMITIAALVLSTASFAGTKINCDGTGTDYSNGNCERNNSKEPVGNKH
jgi:hypothetical protein